MATTHPADKRKNRNIELLAPGGDPDAVKAAIIAGADAVYCGLPRFNARQRAGNITPRQLRDLILIAHQNDCRIYLTLNTLVTTDELQEVADTLAGVQFMGVDAIIVQDPGILWMIKNHFPDLEVHASTQMTTHNTGQLALLCKLGVSQVNLCRELSIEEITPLCAGAHQRGMACEIFVHGAWCISFSGQCYMSSVMAGKSGNRGACVQPCRREYRGVRGAREGSPFNLKDNSAFALAGKLAGAGADSFKIEGRIKNYKYVYTTVTAWRAQLNRFTSGEPLQKSDPALETVFNRSLSGGYLEGNIGKEMFIDSSRDQSLEPVCAVRSFTADTGTLKLEKEAVLDPDIPLLIYGAGFTFICTGYPLERTGRFEYRFTITHKLKGKIKSGHMVYRQGSCDVPLDLRQRIDTLQVEKIPMRITLSGSCGKRLRAVFSAPDFSVAGESESSLSEAKKHAFSEEIAREKFGMLGDTMLTLDILDFSGVDDHLFLPLRELNELRRKGVRLLMEKMGQVQKRAVAPRLTIAESHEQGKSPELAILINGEEDVSLAGDVSSLVCFELPVTMGTDQRRYYDLFTGNPGLIPWFPSILIGEHFTAAAAFLRKLKPSRIISDNSGIGMVAAEAGIEWIAGPLLNCTNSFTCSCFNEVAGASGAFVSHELSRVQMQNVFAPEKFSRWYTLYAPLLMMNTRQCILRNTTGCSKEAFDEQCVASCSKTHTLSDKKKNRFFLVKRPGFYNQVYNGRHYFNPALIEDIPLSGAVFLCDIRLIGTDTRLACARSEFVSACADIIRGKKHGAKAHLRKLVRETTAAQYIRGV